MTTIQHSGFGSYVYNDNVLVTGFFGVNAQFAAEQFAAQYNCDVNAEPLAEPMFAAAPDYNN